MYFIIDNKELKQTHSGFENLGKAYLIN